ncbi:Alpha/Beta hydrolase protein [Flammula alnicola]|nr:Alpha/Beta hydrolase protein [Flammula alnicola]
MKPFSAYGRAKSWKRILADTFLYHTLTNMNRRQARAFYGPTRTVYNNFVKGLKYPQAVEELGDDSRLLWVGPKRTERVMLYLHGGGFVLGMPEPAPVFWRFIQESLEKRGKPTGLAILNYSPIPDRPFPTQLNQTILAIQHLLDSGVKPENLQLVGDSAGGALIHGVFSHILHPLEGIPKLQLSSPLGGAYYLSTWSKLVDKDGCLHTNEGRGDFLNGNTCGYWGAKCMEDVPEPIIPYLEGNSAPTDWLKGIDKCVKRILLSIGEAEVLRDTILEYANIVKKYHPNTTVIMQEHGAHNDPYTDFLTGTKNLGNLTPLVLDWVDKGFSEKDD